PALENARQELGGVAEEPHGARLLLRAGPAHDLERLIEALGRVIQIPGAQAHVDARALTLDGQTRRAGHDRRQRLGAAHAAEPRGEQPAAGEVAAIMMAAHLDEGLVGSLDDALAA